jgi:DNA modification methylase
MPIEIFHGDCVPGLAGIADSSIHMCVSSIPFGSLFSYSHTDNDIGNNADGVNMHEGQFGLHLSFFIAQLFRVMVPGSMSCIHTQQLLRYKNQHGYAGMRDFRGAVITLFENQGFEITGEVAIRKNPQMVAQKLKLHNLLFKTGRTDARRLAPAMNDYVLLFRKPGDGSEYAVKAVYDAVKNPGGWVTPNDWIKWAHGCWIDISEMDVLQGQKRAKENDEEKHVCPLQLEVIRRFVLLYSRPDDTVLDPFMGIGSTAVVALKNGRSAIGFELKASYHKLALENVETANEEMKRPGNEGLLKDIPEYSKGDSDDTGGFEDGPEDDGPDGYVPADEIFGG